MQKVTSIESLRHIIKQWRQQGQSIAFVPTMGNLHAGHIKLVTEAGKKADKVVVSIFVNPTQFGEGEDFESYPRTALDDEQKLHAVATDLLFIPAVEEMYPDKALTVISVAGVSVGYCGASRPGHFEGVATVVSKLFNIVQPDFACFGEKDFQQLTVIRRMVRDLDIPVEIVAVTTEREPDGLAMSSRNGYLTEQQRLLAPLLYQSLCQARDSVLQGVLNMTDIELQQQLFLTKQGFDVDYFSICRSDDLQPAMNSDKQLIILAAAKLGKPRLIDNIYLSK